MRLQEQNETEPARPQSVNTIEHEIATNPRYAKARTWALIFCGMYLWEIVIGVITLTAASIAGWIQGAPQQILPLAPLSLIIPIAVVVRFYRRNNLGLLRLGLLIPVFRIMFIFSDDYRRVDYNVTWPLIAIIAAVLMFALPIFREYARRTKEIKDARRKELLGYAVSKESSPQSADDMDSTRHDDSSETQSSRI